MTTKLLFLSLALASSVASAKDCVLHIRFEYEQKGNRVINITLEASNETTSIYNVRGNLHSGDYLDQVTTNAKTCSIESVTNIWAE